MNIKKVDDKPMVIHTKEKPRLKIKGVPETKIKGRNVLTVKHGPKIAGDVAEKNVAADERIKLKRVLSLLRIKEKQGRQKRLLTAWRTGTDTAETHRIEKGTGPHRAETTEEPHRAEKRAEPHRAEIQTQSCRAGKGRSRKSGSP